METEEVNHVVIQQGIDTNQSIEFRIYSTQEQLKSGYLTWSIVKKDDMDEPKEILTGAFKPTKNGLVGNLKRYLKTYLL